MVDGLTRRVSEYHLRQIFELYGPSLDSVTKDDPYKATVTYTNRKDALYAMDHLMPTRNQGAPQTVIDGRPIWLKMREVKQKFHKDFKQTQ